MSGPPEDRVLILHASDGLEWSHFIATRLANPVYNIQCKISILTSHCDGAEKGDNPNVDQEGEAIYCNENPTNTNNNNNNNSNNNNNKNNNDTESNNKDLNSDISSNSSPIKPPLPGKRASKLEETDTKTPTLNDEINKYGASVILVTPSIVESNRSLEMDINTLKPRSTVFLFLGVELVDARAYFGDDFDLVTKCKCGFVYSTEQQPITDAMVQIIEAYEDTGESDVSDEFEDTYQVPKNQRQLNRIKKVFPKELSETERDVCITLEWPPEDSVSLVLEEIDADGHWKDSDKTVELTTLGEQLYMFTLPDSVIGDCTYFHLECQGQSFGRTKLRIPSKLDRLRAILDEEVNPLSLLASAVGIPRDDTGNLDANLSVKLQQLSHTIKLQYLFPFDDDVKQSHSDRPSSVRWPTLLHFAAEWNLRTLCSELLRFPGMVLAACTENSDGEFPSQIASRKGFNDLEGDLLQFMEEQRVQTECEYVQPGPPLPPPRSMSSPDGPMTSPRPRSKTARKCDDESPYCDMSTLARNANLSRLIRKPRAMSESSLFRKTLLANHGRSSPNIQRRGGSETLATPKAANRRLKSQIAGSHSFSQGDLVPKPKLGETRQSMSIDDDNLYVTMEGSLADRDSLELDSPDGSLSPQDRLSSLSGSPTSKKALKRLGVCEEDILRSSIIEGKNQANTLSASTPPGYRPHRVSSKFYVDDPRASLSSNWEEEYSPFSKDFDKKTVKMERMKSFFSKITGGSKRVSDGKKMSKGRRGSESSDKSLRKDSLLPFDMERDSGSYSDEENSSKVVHRHSSKDKIFKQSNKPMGRRQSKRVETVKKETISNYPNLPGKFLSQL